MINVQIETDQKLVKLKEKSIIKLVSVVMKSEDINQSRVEVTPNQKRRNKPETL